MFFRYDELQPEELQDDRYQRAVEIAQGLPEAEVRSIERRMVSLYLPNIDEVIDGDVTRNGFTVYLGGFDWVTFAAPPHVMSRFPDFQPLSGQSTFGEELLSEGDVPASPSGDAATPDDEQGESALEEASPQEPSSSESTGESPSEERAPADE